LYNHALSDWALAQVPDRLLFDVPGGEASRSERPDNKVNETKDVPEAEPPLTSEDVVDSVVEQVRSVTDPLGRLALIDKLSRDLVPAIYEEAFDTVAEFRESGGTWREVGEQLGITPQGAQGRFDPNARQRYVEKARRQRSKK